MEERENKMIDVIRRPAGDFFADVAELGIDEILSRMDEHVGIMKDIPIIKWLFIGRSIFGNIHLAFFIKKYALFIGPINEKIPDNFWNDERINELIGNKKKFENIIEETIVALDRYQAVNKAKLLGILFVKTFKEQLFTIEEYNTLLFSIELMHPYRGVQCLKDFYNYRLDMDKPAEQRRREKAWLNGSNLDFSPLATTCLLRLPKGDTSSGNLGGAFLNDLGLKFYEEVVSNVEDS